MAKKAVFDAKTGITTIIEVEEDQIPQDEVIQPPSIEERLKSAEDMILLLMEAGLMP